MKQAGARALAFCEKPQGRTRIALVFGADPGLVSTSADQLAGNWLPSPDPFNIIRMSEEELKADRRRLADELVARSLLGGERLVRVRLERETGARYVMDVLADVEKGMLTPEACWIVEAGDLNRTSKLRAAFEAAEKAVALHLFADDERSLVDLVTRRLAGAGVSIEPPALAAFVADMPADRRLALSEIEKLELFAAGLERALSVHDIALLASGDQPRGADDAADAAILGQAMEAGVSINRYLDAGGNPVSALRTLHFRMLRVLDALASGAGSGMRLRPPVFEADWPAFSRALREWSAPAVHRTFARLYEAEKTCKQAGAPSEAILRRLIHAIATRTL